MYTFNRSQQSLTAMNDSPELLDQIRPIIQRALDEDLGDGDVTTLCTIPEDATLEGRFIAKADGIIAGLEVARMTFDRSVSPC